MQRAPRALIFCLALLAGGPATAAHEIKAGNLVIVHPWARQSAEKADAADGYFKVRNTGTKPDRLTAVTLDVAAGSAITGMMMRDGAVSAISGIEIPPGATVAFSPAAMHIIFPHLPGALVPDTEVSGSLVFEGAGRWDVDFEID
jgi:copper(I)-binding protein